MNRRIGSHPRRLLSAWIYGIALSLLLSASLSPPSSFAAEPEVYRLSIADSFQVYVLGEEDLSIDVTVNNDGSIFYPLLGEIPVVGKTTAEVETLLIQRLKGDYLVDPKISVTMTSYRQFFLEGAVNNPGPHQYRPGLTIRKAILKAGGFSPLASESRIYVFGENENPEQRKKRGQDHPVKPGDTIVVEESFF